ncbi:MAG: hypothetical protein MJ197_09755 [Bacteroidales bacterium]|nr:hypothetical protein [Bacteroidales bacterium]
MYLENITKQTEKYITKVSKECSTYAYFYEFWKEHLLERVQRLFVYKNLPDTLPQKEIEMPLYLRGHVGLMHYKNELTAFNGTFSGVTKYIDEFTHYSVFSPVYSGRHEIGKDIVIIDNTSLRNALLPLIHHYAVALGHVDVTLVDALINARDSGGVPVATNEIQKKSIEDYQTKLYKGQFGYITDYGNLGVQYIGGSRGSGQSLKEIYEIREKLIKSFYQAIGIKGSFEKNNNTIVDEVTSDTSLLQINIHDMLECRQSGIEKVNAMFGTNISVDLAPEILDLYRKGNEDNDSMGNVSKDETSTDTVVE